MSHLIYSIIPFYAALFSEPVGANVLNLLCVLVYFVGTIPGVDFDN